MILPELRIVDWRPAIQSAYEAAVGLAGWDVAAFESAWCPTAEQLLQLRSSAISDLGLRPWGR